LIEELFRFRSSQTIVAKVPQFSSILSNMSWIHRAISIPISFVRRDGVIYLTPLVFTYTPQSTPIGNISTANDMILPARE
jgi:recombining binding protein (suppressor of hairless)